MELLDRDTETGLTGHWAPTEIDTLTFPEGMRRLGFAALTWRSPGYPVHRACIENFPPVDRQSGQRSVVPRRLARFHRARSRTRARRWICCGIETAVLIAGQGLIAGSGLVARKALGARGGKRCRRSGGDRDGKLRDRESRFREFRFARWRVPHLRRGFDQQAAGAVEPRTRPGLAPKRTCALGTSAALNPAPSSITSMPGATGPAARLAAFNTEISGVADPEHGLLVKSANQKCSRGPGCDAPRGTPTQPKARVPRLPRIRRCRYRQTRRRLSRRIDSQDLLQPGVGHEPHACRQGSERFREGCSRFPERD